MKRPISLSFTQQSPGSQRFDAAKALVREAQAARLDQVSSNLDFADRQSPLQVPTTAASDDRREISGLPR